MSFDLRTCGLLAASVLLAGTVLLSPASADTAKPGTPAAPPAAVAPPTAPPQMGAPAAAPNPGSPDAMPPSGPPPNPLNLTPQQQTKLTKIANDSSAALAAIVKNGSLSDSQKVDKLVALSSSTKARQLALLDTHQRAIILNQEAAGNKADPIHPSQRQRAQITLLEYTLRNRAISLMNDKKTSQKSKMAALASLDKERETRFMAILTPAQRKVMAQLRAQQPH